MANIRSQVQQALHGVRYPARRRALVAHARSRQVPSDVVNTIHRLPDTEYRSPTHVDEAVDQVHRNERQVWEMLDAPEAPTAPLSETTDYEQIVLAWGKRHVAAIDELIDQLDATGSPLAQNLAAALRADRNKRAIFAAALAQPLSGDARARANVAG